MQVTPRRFHNIVKNPHCETLPTPCRLSTHLVLNVSETFNRPSHTCQDMAVSYTARGLKDRRFLA